MSEWLLFKAKWATHLHLEFDSFRSLKQHFHKHIAPIWHVIMIPSQPVLPHTPSWYVPGREAENTNFIVLDLIRMGLESHVKHYTNDVVLWSQFTTDMFRLPLSQSGPFHILDYQRVCTKRNTTDSTSVTGTATLPENLSLSRILSGVCAARSLVFCVVFCRSLFVLLSFIFWPFHCLPFDLQFLITPLVLSLHTLP